MTGNSHCFVLDRWKCISNGSASDLETIVHFSVGEVLFFWLGADMHFKWYNFLNLMVIGNLKGWTNFVHELAKGWTILSNCSMLSYYLRIPFLVNSNKLIIIQIVHENTQRKRGFIKL